MSNRKSGAVVPGKGPVVFPPGFAPRFLVTVDVEEEFDWNAPLRREGYSLETIPELARFQEFCEGRAVSPVYLVDYPVATCQTAQAVLGPALAAGNAEIGAQLHGWVNPPFDEALNPPNSFAGNLPHAVEAAKYHTLHQAIVQAFGQQPVLYRAGRYGIGPNTPGILAQAGVRLDSSVRATFDYSAEGGPNFRDAGLHPYWVDHPTPLIELPLTTVYWGVLRQLGPALYPVLWRMPRLRGVLAKTGILERISLTPEGITLDEARRGIDVALDENVSVLVLSFHSPSLAAGYSPYSRTPADVDRLYAWFSGVFDYLAKRGVSSTTAADIFAASSTPDITNGASSRVAHNRSPG